ncbi:hypothetical protein KI688_006328 [Linnemannia hyalina]|uniref:Uncharacterized protein n=1 Tax=Linnemannia hyalina TaxID=64524 RepID=A0A9P7Y5U5_9FUNG|nr:hypothetical protein KI688_006328 [Linnemannia hyalina]
MEGSSATTAQPTMDATTPGIDVSTPNTISSAVLNDAVSENVKNIKRKVISVSKLMEIFKNKESEMDAVKKELEAAKAQIGTLQQAVANTPVVNNNEVDELKAEAEVTKTKLKESEAQISKLAQSLKSQQMLNHQLEEKTHGQERLTAEVLDLQKKLSLTNKNLEQANRKRSTEVTALREKLMKATAENSDRAAWIAENRKKWQQEEETRKSKRETELESKVEELTGRLDDVATERYLDMELAKEEVKTAEEKHQRLAKKVEELHEKQKALNTIIIDLRNENSELERRLENHQDTEEFMEMGGADDFFEEIIPEQGGAGEAGGSQQTALISTVEHTKSPIMTVKSPIMTVKSPIMTVKSPIMTIKSPVLAAKSPIMIKSPVMTAKSPVMSRISKPTGPMSPPMAPVQLNAGDLSKLQLDSALDTLEQLKTQFSMLRWVSGSTDDKQRIAILEEQVVTLTKERSALQETLTRQLTMPRPFTPPSPHIPTSMSAVTAPTADDTIARVEPPARKGKRRRIEEEVEDLEMDLDHGVVTGLDHHEDIIAYVKEPVRHSGAITLSASSAKPAAPSGTTASEVPETPIRRKPGRPKKNPEAVPEPPKQKRKYTKRETKASVSTTDFSQLEIRNISVNPLTPSITNPLAYFSSLMNSPIVDDSQAHTKLDIIATILPAKLDALFEAVQKKIPDIVSTVKAHRKKFIHYSDKVQAWSLDGFDDITISKSFSDPETNIALLICLLDARFPEIGIPSKFYTFAYESILHEATKEDRVETTSILLRVLTAVNQAKNDSQPIHILAYDLLRETTIPKVTLFLSETIAAVWPSIFIIPSDAKDEADPRRLMFTAFQAVLGSLQAGAGEGTKNYFATFTKKCGWPVFDEAPYMDEVIKSIMDTVQAPGFVEKCQTTPGFEFSIRKALELLLIYAYDWEELFNDVLKPTLFKQIFDPTLHKFALPLVAAVVREARCKSVDSEGQNTTNETQPVLQMLNAILKAEATLSHQAQSALAIVALSNGQREQLAEVCQWYEGLKQAERVSMPRTLQDVLA